MPLILIHISPSYYMVASHLSKTPSIWAKNGRRDDKSHHREIVVAYHSAQLLVIICSSLEAQHQLMNPAAAVSPSLDLHLFAIRPCYLDNSAVIQ